MEEHCVFFSFPISFFENSLVLELAHLLDWIGLTQQVSEGHGVVLEIYPPSNYLISSPPPAFIRVPTFYWTMQNARTGQSRNNTFLTTLLMTTYGTRLEMAKADGLLKLLGKKSFWFQVQFHWFWMKIWSKFYHASIGRFRKAQKIREKSDSTENRTHDPPVVCDATGRFLSVFLSLTLNF